MKIDTISIRCLLVSVLTFKDRDEEESKDGIFKGLCKIMDAKLVNIAINILLKNHCTYLVTKKNGPFGTETYLLIYA